MATPLLQKARQRKIVYFGAIAVLFTLSLIQKELLLKPQAFALQLREVTRGEVELTSSAVRLMLTGSRGLAVTLLWYNAMDMQKRNEWHEVELLVKSITKLQPYFVTPWLYQSWNLAFNVAVECDQPRDKYFYVSRGLELLSEGERRNRGAGADNAARDPSKIAFPGNPDMRYYMGFFLQLKVGASDERMTMRSLLEMSCIDPVERNPDRFWTTSESGKKEVDVEKFARFCQKYPRLIRRLREHLDCSEPASVVRFLQDNMEIPNRFKPVEKSALANLRQSELKEPLEQFPILPPHEGRTWPDPTKYDYDLTDEAVDVFLVCRTWYDYAQKPLPPPNPEPGVSEPSYDKMRYRVPKNMVTHLFRQYPPRAQVFIAETLESEGFFDADGWEIDGWFKALPNRGDSEFFDADGRFVVGKEPKYHSGLAWNKGHRMYLEYGQENGLYLDPDLVKELNKSAELCRRELDLKPGQQPNVPWQSLAGDLSESLKAHERLRFSLMYRTVANYDTFLYQSDGERDPVTVAMRKYLFQAERKRKRDTPSELTLALYEQAWPLYVHTCLQHPKFAQVTSMQEDLYEIHQNYLGASQRVHPALFKNVALWGAHRALGPMPSLPVLLYHEAVINKVAGSQAQMEKVVPFRNRRGPLDRVQYYDGPAATELREWLFLWTQGAAVDLNPNLATRITYPGHAGYLLTRAVSPYDPAPTYWQRLITDETHRVAGIRLNLPLVEQKPQ